MIDINREDKASMEAVKSALIKTIDGLTEDSAIDMLSLAEPTYEHVTMFSGMSGKKGEAQYQIFKVIFHFDEFKKTGQMLISTSVLKGETIKRDFMRIERGVSVFGDSIEDFVPVYLNNYEDIPSELLHYHIDLLTLEACKARVVFVLSSDNKVGLTELEEMENGFKNAVKLATENWTSYANTFKTIQKSTIKEEIQKEGLNKFIESTWFRRSKGIPYQMFQKFVVMNGKRIGIGHLDSSDTLKLFEDIRYAESEEWHKLDFTVDSDEEGPLKYSCYTGAHEKNAMQYHFFYMLVKQTFGFAKDTMIIEQSKSVSGSAFEDQKQKYMKRASSLSDEDI